MRQPNMGRMDLHVSRTFQRQQFDISQIVYNVAMAEREHLEALDKLFKQLLAFDVKMRQPILALMKAYNSLSPEEAKAPLALCMRSGHVMGADYYLAVMNAVQGHSPLSAGGTTRTLIELVADMYHICHQPTKRDKRAKRYIDSVGIYGDAMRTAVEAMNDGVDVRLKNVNPWTCATVDDRIQKLGKSTVNMYDYLSCLTHANPMGVVMLEVKPLTEALKVTVVGGAIQSMITLMHIAIQEGGAQGVTLDEILALQAEFKQVGGDQYSILGV